jgi:cellobiose-specific phosphotransferase system component IIA
MKKILLFLSVAILMMACNSGGNSPKATVEAMFAAMKNGNLDDMKKYITKSDVALLEAAEKVMVAFDPEASKKMKEKMTTEFKDKVKDVTFILKDEKITGDNATVTAEITQNGKMESQNIDLLKEDGVWKVSFTKSGFGGGDKAKMDEEMKNMNPDSIASKIKQGLEQMKNVNMDSLRQEMNKALENSGASDSSINKMKELMEKARQGH